MTTTPTIELAKTYKPADVESQIAARWADSNAFHADPHADGDSYAIVIPPPNVTAALHMGHALNNTLQDILTRWRRMQGRATLWMPGTDHAGIATQTVVEKRVLQEEGKRRTDFERDEFVQKIQAWKDEYEARITHQLKEMGCSCDWDRQRFTMDAVCAAAVREAFFQLFKDGLIYRGKRLVNWDPVTQTALADDEVEMEEIDGHFWYLKYPLVEPVRVIGETVEFEMTHVTVATTRPETMLGDTAVAVNPNDPRAAALRGKCVKLPIVDRIIPIIEDDYVVLPAADPENCDDPKAKYATGFLKVTPAHDPNDWDIGQRHFDTIEKQVGFVVLNVMGPDGSISRDHGWSELEENIHEAAGMLGMDRYEAREAIVTWFRENNLLQEVKPYRHTVGHSYRSHVPIEPYLSDQWYVKVTDKRLAGAALRAMVADQRSESEGAIWRSDSGGWAGVSPANAGGVGVSPANAGGVGVPPANRPQAGISPGQLHRHRRRLPHMQLAGRVYFVTFRLVTGEMTEAERQIVLDACMHWHAKRADVHLVTVMPDHVHMLIQPRKRDDGSWYALPDLLHSIKSFSAHQINERRGTEGAVWQNEYFDRIVRDEDEYVEKFAYMQTNPVKAGLCERRSEYPFTLEGEPVRSDEEDSDLRSDGGRDAHPTEDGGRDARPTTGEEWEGSLRFYPPRYARTFQTWHENIRDWCISRQLWWGHRIPVWSAPYLPAETYSPGDRLGFLPEVLQWEKEGRLVYQGAGRRTERADVAEAGRISANFVCVRSHDDHEVIAFIERHGFQRDPDVLDTWFSSALWPISTMGWPNPDAFTEGTPDGSPAIPEGSALLNKFNPTNTLCTAREIITLWVSRMVMFNTYFRNCLPYTDVFIHAMIQDGEGQKMSKSLGNGVDPLDIIHSHGADAMRFTLAQMTTQTQDVRMPVDVVCPHTGQMFSPQMKTLANGIKVARPIQQSPGDKSKKMVTSYGIASGEATPTDQIPAARNTSSKFDVGRNFANKLWNAVRFALNAASEAGEFDGPQPPMTLAGLWMLSRTTRVIEDIDKALESYDFHNYANRLYQFVWNDVCDWYIESIKGVVRKPEAVRSRQVLYSVLDVVLRLLHPSMPFVTEKLWEGLNAVAPRRGLRGLDLPDSALLVKAAWPKADRALIDLEAEETYGRVQEIVGMIREARTSAKIPPRETVEVSVKASAEVAADAQPHVWITESLANVKIVAMGPDVAKPEHAVVVVRPLAEVYLHQEIDLDAERARLNKQLAEAQKSIKALEGRLNNKGYTEKAPAHLVQQTRDELARRQSEAAAIEQQLAALG